MTSSSFTKPAGGRFQPMARTASVGFRTLALVAVGLMLATGVADAKGKSFGSRGSKTFSAPPATSTAPTGGAPLQRTTTQPAAAAPAAAAPATSVPGISAAPRPAAAAPAQAAPRPAAATVGAATAGAAAAQAARPSFARSMMMGVAGGLLGAGLFGLLSGAGLFSGLGSLAGMFGFLLQLGLIAGVVFLVMKLLRRRNEPAMASAGAPASLRRPEDVLRRTAQPVSAAPVAAAAAVTGVAAGSAANSNVLTISPSDFEAFQRALVEIQQAYGQEDESGLRRNATEEMAGYFSEAIAENARQGVTNRVGGAELLQGDLAEAWRDADADYATVAMRYALTDVTLDRATGRVVDGDPRLPIEVTELWTFRRELAGAASGRWKLSAIQQPQDIRAA